MLTLFQILQAMKNVITIADVMFGKVFTNKNQIDTQLVNLNTVEKIHQFKMNEDGEKEEVEKRQIAIPFSDFTRMLVLDGMLGLVPECAISEEDASKPKDEQDRIKYSNVVRCLRGAKLTIKRDEDWEVVPDETKPKQNAEGEAEVDEYGEQVYEPLIGEDGKPVKKLVGYRNLEVVAVELSAPAAKLAEHLAFV